ncbi:UbiX family flavin prenyltransferase [Peterkaempfera bronchialis]|uniref:Flavin prenyltransferase UbiX n=1 Tax=Peterkaempfera bronchialis TaxID=2126346 RepID=A0A345T679_9ACTN|nr:UbiX family flavin prenyltransferase [Peterkaempfera bronchialis]AXI81484.1 UbiX family flavin prenyltransferase [Peterkaempfera bronchialis]
MAESAAVERREQPQGHLRRPWVVGVSGASGTPYAASVVRALLAAGEDVDLVVSRAARLTVLDETGISFRDAHWRDDLRAWLAQGLGDSPPPPETQDRDLDRVRYWAAGDLAAGPSSGSYPVKGMLVVPASTAAVAGIALGLSKDLLQRAASVTLKERRPLVVAVRETPLNGQTLRHLVALDDAGAVVLPASPAFYAGGSTAQQLVDFVAGRVLDAAGVQHTLYRRWRGSLGEARSTGVKGE